MITWIKMECIPSLAVNGIMFALFNKYINVCCEFWLRFKPRENRVDGLQCCGGSVCRDSGLKAEGSCFKTQHRQDLKGALVVGQLTLLSILGYCRSMDLLSQHATQSACVKGVSRVVQCGSPQAENPEITTHIARVKGLAPTNLQQVPGHGSRPSTASGWTWPLPVHPCQMEVQGLYSTARANLKRHQGSQGCLQKEGQFPQQWPQTGVAGGSTTAGVTCSGLPAQLCFISTCSPPVLHPRFCPPNLPNQTSDVFPPE